MVASSTEALTFQIPNVLDLDAHMLQSLSEADEVN